MFTSTISTRFIRPGQAQRPVEVPIAFALAYVLFAAAGFALTTNTGGLAVLWLCNGILAAAFLLLPARSAMAVAAIGFSADLTCSWILGRNPLALSAMIATVDLSEAALAAVLARRVCGAALDVTRPHRLMALAVFAILPATLSMGTVGGTVLALMTGVDLVDQVITWTVSDLLGMVIALPAALLIVRPARFGASSLKSPARLALILGVGGLTAAIFVQDQVHVLTQVVLMTVFLLPFVLSPACVAIVIVEVVLIAAGLTTNGYGPVAADTPTDSAERVLHLQTYLAILATAALVVTALVAERDRSRRSLGRTLIAVGVARRRADNSAMARARFMAAMSHEMRTPLNGVLGHGRALVARQDLPLEAAASALAIRTSAETLSCLIEDVLDFSQLDSAKLQLCSSPCDVGEIVERVAAMGRSLVGDKPITVEVVGAHDLGLLYDVDGRRLSQVLLQLVANAVKFSFRGEIRISVHATNGAPGTDNLRFTVTDNGEGVPVDQLDRIFAPFHQVDGSTTRRHGGVGLGLAISRALVELMGGRIGVSNRAEGGAEFWFEIAALRVAPAAEAEDACVRPRVLVVDDHMINLEVAKIYLEELGCEIVCCEDGQAALSAMEKGVPFNLVFMDIHMPGMDGLEATRAIRALAHPAAETPIVALTAASTAADVDACIDAGMTAHLSKPIRAERLADALMRYAKWDVPVGVAA